MSFLVLIVIALALLYGFLNGMHDSRNVVSTLISSRAYSARVALGVTALAEFAGPFVFGVAVAQSIGRSIVDSKAINPLVLIVALGAAILWNLITWFMRLPSSSSHALIGGILGAASMHAGAGVIQVNGLFKVLVSLFASPIIGFMIGFFVLRLILFLFRNATPRINEFFKNSQLVTALVLGLSHGSNDGQKSMGMIVLALLAGGYLATFTVPLWVITICALALSFGTAIGGWRLLRRVGTSFYKIRPVDGFATQLTSSLVIIVASLVGGPVSATQVINTAILGIGAAERANKVRWGIAQEIITAWIFTIPVAGLIAAGLYYVLSRVGF